MTDPFITPDEWNIKIEKRGNKAKVVWEELIQRNDIPKERWNAIVDLNLDRFSNIQDNIKEVRRTDDEFYIRLEFEGEFKSIVTEIIADLLPFSKAKDITFTFSELVQCAILGMDAVTKFREAVERKVVNEKRR